MSFRDRLQVLGYRDYSDYLASDHWADVKQRFYASKLFKGGCLACSATGPLNVHHRTYRRLGAEWLRDLVVLCNTCHRAVHALEKERGERLAAATRNYIQKTWLRLLRRPKRTGQWSKQYQCAYRKAHAGDVRRVRGRRPPFGGQHAV